MAQIRHRGGLRGGRLCARRGAERRLGMAQMGTQADGAARNHAMVVFVAHRPADFGRQSTRFGAHWAVASPKSADVGRIQAGVCRNRPRAPRAWSTWGEVGPISVGRIRAKFGRTPAELGPSRWKSGQRRSNSSQPWPNLNPGPKSTGLLAAWTESGPNPATCASNMAPFG